VVGTQRLIQSSYLPSLYRKHIQDNGRLVAIGSSLAAEITMQNHQEIEKNPALQAARNETEMAIQADLPEEMRGRMTLTSAQAAASPVIRDEAQAQHERKLEVMDKTHEQKIQLLQEQSESKLQLLREQGEVKIRIRELELKNNLDTIRLRHELKITNSSDGSTVPRTRKSVRQGKQILVQPDTDIKNPKDLEQAVAVILDDYFHPSTKTKDCIPVENIKEIVRAVLDKNLLDFSWSEEEKNVYVTQLDSLGWNFVVDLFLSAKQQYKKAVVTRAPNASVLCKLGSMNCISESRVLVGIHLDHAKAENLAPLMPANPLYMATVQPPSSD